MDCLQDTEGEFASESFALLVMIDSLLKSGRKIPTTLGEGK